jgi:4,5-DOPA dioxygenase extradiol
MYALSQNRYTEAWRRIGENMSKPRAILAISAHWYTRGTRVTAMQQPHTIHDFGGFPRELFEMQYPAPGSYELATRVATFWRLSTCYWTSHGAWITVSGQC